MLKIRISGSTIPDLNMETPPSKEFEFIEGLAKELSSKDLIFPTSLEATMRIRSALNTTDISTAKMARIVGTEPVLTAQLLKLANSAAIRVGGGQITELQTAITRLGLSMVRNVAISVGMRQLSQAQGKDLMPKEIGALWKHSIFVAATSYLLTRKLTKLNPDEAMLAGLMHDIGIFYILTRAQNYPALFADKEVLQDVIHQWHAEIGEAILESWEIPEGIQTAVKGHESFDRAHSAPPDLGDVVMVANIIAEHPQPDAPENIDWNSPPSAFLRLKMDAETCNAVMRESEEEIKLIVQALG
jgi:putative nucleotidyltransferase with HDIG domain